jgi:hypothetical protein
MGAAHAQLTPQNLSQPTQQAVTMGDNLILTLKNTVQLIEQNTSQNHVVIFEELGTSGCKALLTQFLAKGAVNASQAAASLTPAESVRVLAALADLAAGNAIDATVADITPKEALIAQSGALSAQSYAIEGAAMTQNETFTVDVSAGDGSVVATTVIVEAPEAP